MIRRPPRSTQSRSSAASDVYKRQEKLQKLGMSSSLFGDGDLKAVFDAFQWYCSNHKAEGGKIDLPLFTAYLTEERHVTPAIATLVGKLIDAGGEDMTMLVEILD